MKSTEQQSYLKAREAYETIEQAISDLMDATMSIPESDDSEGIETYCQIEESLRTDLKAYEIWDALRKTENALIAWGQEQAKTVKEYRAYQGMLDDMFSKIEKFPVYRQKLIALIMKLDASPRGKGKAA